MCQCGHPDHKHSKVLYPARRYPCDMCVQCGRRKFWGSVCCLNPQPCPCRDFQRGAA